MSQKPTLSVVIPVFEEADHIGRSLKVIHESVVRCQVRHEMIVVNDGSRDATPARLQALLAELEGLRIIHFTRNFGKEAALQAGLAVSRGEAIITIDGDLQHPPELIPEMLEVWQRGKAKVVNGVKRRRSRGVRDMAGRVYYRIFRVFSGADLRRSTDYKLLDRTVVEDLLALSERARLYRGLVAWMDYPSVDLEFDVRQRTAGGSRWSLSGLLGLSIDGITAFSSVPLQFVSIVGVIFLVVAIGLGAHTLWVWLTGSAAEGFPTVILLLLLIGSILMIALGVTGQYIARIYEEIKGRPSYIIRSEEVAEEISASSDRRADADLCSPGQLDGG